MSRFTLFTRTAAVCLVAGLCVDSAHALEIEEVQWGFDGQVVQNRFNVLSVLVSNPSAEAFDGGMSLEKPQFGGSGSVGVVLRQPVFLSPFAKKWVQFHPFVNYGFSDWRLKWGEGRNSRRWGRSKEERYDVNKPRLGPAAYVILNAPGELLHRGKGSGLKGMAENLFPPIVTATDGLKGIVLDHSPRWQRPRRTAFLDWLHRGGELHLLKMDDDTYPQFPAPLADLNAPLPVQNLGQGHVYRHDRTRAEMTAEFVKQSITHRGEQPRDEDQKIEVRYGVQNNNLTDEFGSQFDASMLQSLKAMTQPDHNWTVIYLMSFVYLLLIFPGGYLLGRRRIDYRIMIAALLGTITLFSVGFSIVGARGYNEATAVNTVAIAHPLPGGFYDIAAWSNAFVTSGDDYLIVHPGQGRLYSTCQSQEGVAGFVNEDPAERFFAVDIPPYSSRTFAHRAKAPGKPLDFQVDSFVGGNLLESFKVTIGPELQKSFKQGYVVYGNMIYRLRDEKGQLTADRRGQKVNAFVNSNYQIGYGFNAAPFSPLDSKDEIDLEEKYGNTFLPLIIRSLNFTHTKQARKFQLPTDRARLFLITTLPPEFQMSSEVLGQQDGRVLYSFDVFK
ncbi:hypothetical protein CA54_37150 [Symmachiella macrocystis]|uniref:Uncharacterized protein n=1 Tax=Symmachiella macrocystis TaxID=2527985 RepID=A0A5C6BSC5_9PLAN|nr:hypothetical protein [Symmachiella macrocystis]TWU14845.1 hypothetical protein CA54_37150 [Symmachiella macrocystis]